MESKSEVKKGRPRSSSQPTETSEKMIKEPFLSPRRKKGLLFGDTNIKRVDIMSNHSHYNYNSGISIDESSVEGGFPKRSRNKNYRYDLFKTIRLSLFYRNYRKKQRKLKRKYPHLMARSKRSFKREKWTTIKDIDRVMRELETITSPVLFVDVLWRTLKERNKSLVRNVVDELGPQEWARLLYEVALIQQNGKFSPLNLT